MEDLIKSIKAHLYDRATSPLFGTFAVSWVIWNYKFIIIIFSSMEAHEKFDYIATFLYPSINSCLSTGLAYPALTTLTFIFLYPYPAKFVYSFTRKKQKELKEIKQKIEDETPLTHEESKKIRRDMAALELEYEKELERRSSETQRLKDLVEELKNEMRDDSSTRIDDSSEISKMEFIEPSINVNEEQLELLDLVSNNDYPSEKDIVKWSKTTKVKTEYNLGELVNNELLSDHYSSKGKSYSITHKGRTLLVKAGKVD
ncbi:MAG: hypothetical protein QM484_01045 [Woeseiaceae bacterium]